MKAKKNMKMANEMAKSNMKMKAGWKLSWRKQRARPKANEWKLKKYEAMSKAKERENIERNGNQCEKPSGNEAMQAKKAKKAKSYRLKRRNEEWNMANRKKRKYQKMAVICGWRKCEVMNIIHWKSVMKMKKMRKARRRRNQQYEKKENHLKWRKLNVKPSAKTRRIFEEAEKRKLSIKKKCQWNRREISNVRWNVIIKWRRREKLEEIEEKRKISAKASKRKSINEISLSEISVREREEAKKK